MNLVLLPGMLCDAALWQAPRSALATIADCQVIEPAGQDIEAMAEAVLAAAPKTFALAGLSLGGYVALAIQRRAPERVRALCLVNTGARYDTQAQSERRAAAIAAVQAGKFASVIDSLRPLLTHPNRHADQMLQNCLDDMMRRVGPQNFVRQQRAAAGRPDARPALPAIRVPTMVIAGGADRVIPPEHGAEMAAAIPGATLHVLADCAHLTPLESPDRVSALMRDWLLIAAQRHEPMERRCHV